MALPTGGVSLCGYSTEEDQAAADELSLCDRNLSSPVRELRREKEEWTRKENDWAQERSDLLRRLETLEDTQAWMDKQAEQAAAKLRGERAKKRQAVRKVEDLKVKMMAEVNVHRHTKNELRQTKNELRCEKKSHEVTYAALEAHLRGCPSGRTAEEIVEQTQASRTSFSEEQSEGSVYWWFESDFELTDDPLDDYIQNDVVVR